MSPRELYVAASRATEKLLIVDTSRGEQKLWQYATNETTLQEFIQSTSEDVEKWQHQIHRIHWGESPDNLGKDDPSAIRIDGLTRQVKIGETILKALSEEGLSFISPSGNLGGKVTYHNGNCQVELSIQGIAEKIQIHF